MTIYREGNQVHSKPISGRAYFHDGETPRNRPLPNLANLPHVNQLPKPWGKVICINKLSGQFVYADTLSENGNLNGWYGSG